MPLFEAIVALLFGAVLLTALARRRGAPYPVFLAIGGALLAFWPAGPHLELAPDLALALFVAPVLLDAAFDTSVRDLRDNWMAVTGLVLAAVGITTAAVALVAHALVPGLPWAAAIALGAIVAPPDAAAATAILRAVRLPHRLLVILEGESLLNDASALLVYKLAVGAAVAGRFDAGRIAPTLLLVLVGSVVVGAALSQITLRVTRRVTHVPSSIVIQFVSTFGVWLLADRIGLSPVLTIVVYAITVARVAPIQMPARVRVPSYAVWDLAVFVLNVLAFVLIGLQLRSILDRLTAGQRLTYLGVAAAVLATVLVARAAWVLAASAIAARRRTRNERSASMREGILVSWCGMRGIVTLAAALALPDGSGLGGEATAAFPYRDLLVLTAFCVVLGTLVIQGLTLRPLVGRLALHDGDPVEREVGTARAAAIRAALGSLDGETDPAHEVEVAAIRREYVAALAEMTSAEDGQVPRALPGDDVRRRAVTAAREAVFGLRRGGDIGDNAFHRVEEELDRLELSVTEADGA